MPPLCQCSQSRTSRAQNDVQWTDLLMALTPKVSISVDDRRDVGGDHLHVSDIKTNIKNIEAQSLKTAAV
jgi:hypothetical protein